MKVALLAASLFALGGCALTYSSGERMLVVAVGQIDVERCVTVGVVGGFVEECHAVEGGPMSSTIAGVLSSAATAIAAYFGGWW